MNNTPFVRVPASVLGFKGEWRSATDLLCELKSAIEKNESYHRRKMGRLRLIEKLCSVRKKRKNTAEFQQEFYSIVWLYLELESVCYELRPKELRKAENLILRSIFRCLAKATTCDIPFMTYLISISGSSVGIMPILIRNQILKMYLSSRKRTEACYKDILVFLSFKSPTADESDWISQLRNERRRNDRLVGILKRELTTGHPPKRQTSRRTFRSGVRKVHKRRAA